MPAATDCHTPLPPVPPSLPPPTPPHPPPLQVADGFQLQDLRCVKCTSVASNHLQQHCDVCGGHLRATQMPVGGACWLLVGWHLVAGWGALGCLGRGQTLLAGLPAHADAPTPQPACHYDCVQMQARQQFSVLRNIAEYQDMPLLGELAAWQLQRGGGSS